MPRFDHLIIGGGMTGDAAIKAIRERRSNDSIGLISQDQHAPYNRPPLSKALWKGEPEDSVDRDTAAANVDMRLGRRAIQLDPSAHSVRDDAGETHTYGNLLLATGGKVRTIPAWPEDVIYFRTLDDYRHLRKAAPSGTNVAVIGGGFIGSEVAAGLAMNGANVTMIFPEDGIGARVYPPSLAAHLNDYYRQHGVAVLNGEALNRIERSGGGYRLSMESGKSLEAGAVVAGIGIVPDTELAEQANLTIENGIVVDEYLQTTAPDIYAAGDVASFLNPALDQRIRVEHEDNANTMGAVAGANMAGEPTRYDHLPMFYSDLFDLGYEAVGELDARHQLVEDWKTPFEEGVIYYLDGGRVRGVLLWNTWDQVDNARALIAEPGPFDSSSLKGRLPR